MKKNMMLIAASLAAAALFTARASLADGKIAIAGDPCSIPLITKLAGAFAQKHRDFKAEISTYACTLGVYKAADGEADLGVSTQNGLSENLPRGAVNTVITKSPIVLIVNMSNPVNNLSYRDIQGIFSGKVGNWKEVGGPDMEIKNVMLEPCVRHTLSKQVVMYGENLSMLVPEKKGNSVEYTNRLVSENEGAVGQQIYGYESGNVKVLTVDGLLPGAGADGYTFYQDYNMVTKGSPRGVVKEFIEFAFSTEGKEIIKSLKHQPVAY